MSDDLMFQDQIRDIVRAAYGAITTGAGRTMAQRFYSDEELATVPAEAVDWALGVGNPVRHAGLSVGEVVLDIGSGGGIDTVLAAQRVAPTGQVIGLDALPEMCERAQGAAKAAGVEPWCDLREGEMEAIPLPDETVDVVISNGVINLCADKRAVFEEIRRVLKPGGWLQFADIANGRPVPTEALRDIDLWTG
jgi:SAM-dependent methyltransferase